MVTETQLMTADRLWEQIDTDKHQELIEGVLYTMAPTGWIHGSVVSLLTMYVQQHVLTHDLGEVTGAETGFRLTDTTVIAPDIAFIRKDRLPDTLPDSFVPLAPNLAVEVLSPSNSASEMNHKIELLFAHGTQLVWVVHPRKHKVDVYQPAEQGVNITFLGIEDTLTGEDVLPAFELPLKTLFKKK
ncbi:MAG: Uma2 family endonuclease [Chloroflexota bacterium]